MTGYILSEYTQRNEKLGRPPGVVGSAPMKQWWDNRDQNNDYTKRSQQRSSQKIFVLFWNNFFSERFQSGDGITCQPLIGCSLNSTHSASPTSLLAIFLISLYDTASFISTIQNRKYAVLSLKILKIQHYNPMIWTFLTTFPQFILLC